MISGSQADGRGPTWPITQRAGLKVVNGDMVITTPGTVVENVDVRGFITVKAPNVTIRHSIVRGRPTGPETVHALVGNFGSFPNLTIEDSYLHEQTPAPGDYAGILGSNFTARNVSVKGSIDSVLIIGSNATVENSVLADTVYYRSHRGQGGGPTHSDNIQVTRGDNITIRNNRISGSQNFGILAAPEKGPMNNLRVENNYVDGGLCTMKFSDLGGHSHSAVVRNNIFGEASTVPGCSLVKIQTAHVAVTNNFYQDTSAAVPVREQRR